MEEEEEEEEEGEEEEEEEEEGVATKTAHRVRRTARQTILAVLQQHSFHS